MCNEMPHRRLILASKSPRRRYLLEQAGLEFDVIPSDIDESTITLDTPDMYVQLLAKAKAAEIARRFPDRWVIGADTIVLIDRQILGKPDGKTAARKMLHRLSGQTHQVFTGFAICCLGLSRIHTEAVCTDVTFKALSPGEIEWYIHTDEPFDKAGAYAIQGLGTFLVKSIRGSYTNVVGLPVCEVIGYLISEGIIELHHENGRATVSQNG
jgi:septum formation protein